MAPNWRRLLTSVIRDEELKALRAHERTGRPLGDENFLALLEQNLGRILRRQKPGPKDVQASCRGNNISRGGLAMSRPTLQRASRRLINLHSGMERFHEPRGGQIGPARAP